MEALEESPLTTKEKARCKNFYTLGLMYWVYSRPLEPTEKWLQENFACDVGNIDIRGRPFSR